MMEKSSELYPVLQLRSNTIVAAVGILVVILVGIQAVWLYGANERDKEATELRVKQAIHQTVSDLEEAVACVEFFSKYHMDEGKGYYLSKQSWDSRGFSGIVDTIPMYYDIAEYRGDATGLDIPYKYSSVKFSQPADIDIILRVHFRPGSKSFKSKADSISKDNFKRVISGSNSIDDLLNITIVDSVINVNLEREHVDQEYSFGLYSVSGDTFVYTGANTDTTALRQSNYRVRLFEGDKFISAYQLVLLPKVGFSWQWTGLLMIISIIIIVLLTYAFYVFTRLYRNQEKLSEMKTDFINNLTHEFNTPMANISLALETLNENDHYSKDKLGHILDIISIESNRLKKNIEQALHIATVEKGELVLRSEIVDIGELITAVEPTYTMICSTNGGQLNISLEDGCKVLGDETHLLNCICNILDNAVKYSFKYPVVDVQLSKKEKYITLSISDKGIGMDVETQKHIFDKFYRAHQGNIHDTKGFGLGLNYVRQIIHASGGTIKVKSKLAKGSSFIIKLPGISSK